MAWDESTSASFRARHDSADADDAHRVLQTLERTRGTLEPLLTRLPLDVTVVLHSHPAAVAMSNPRMLVRWASTAPSGRRYVAGWAGRDEIHVLSPAALRERSPAVTGSAQMLELSAAALYAGRALAAANPELARVAGLIRARRELRWAWLLEGAARWLSGQSAHARAAVVRRLRDGSRPSFPPGVRDAPLLGATVLDLLAAEHDDGPRTVARLATRLPSRGPREALERAFGRRLEAIEGDWRAHLSRVASSER